jgi:hypothetical protein
MLLAEQFARGRAQQQGAPGPALRVDLGAQGAEEFGHQLHFVQHDEMVSVPGEEQLGLGQLSAVRGAFEVQHHSPGLAGCHNVRQRALAHLAWPEQQHGRCARHALGQESLGSSINHPCILSGSRSICKEDTLFTCFVGTARPPRTRRW